MASKPAIDLNTKLIETITYVYLKPELSEKRYMYTLKILFPIILLFGIITSAYFLGKYSWQKQPCDGNMAPGIAAIYGWSSKEYVNNCIPDSTPAPVKQGFSTMESSKYETGGSLESIAKDVLQQFSTKISLAMKTLKN